MILNTSASLLCLLRYFPESAPYFIRDNYESSAVWHLAFVDLQGRPWYSIFLLPKVHEVLLTFRNSSLHPHSVRKLNCFDWLVGCFED